MEGKKCVKCNLVKPITEFVKDKTRKNGLSNKCKCCQREYRQRPEIKEYQREYQQKPEIKEYQREYYQRPEMKERQREYQREYQQKPEVKERQREYQREYQQKPEVKERQRERQQKYRKKQITLSILKYDLGLIWSLLRQIDKHPMMTGFDGESQKAKDAFYRIFKISEAHQEEEK